MSNNNEHLQRCRTILENHSILKPPMLKLITITHNRARRSAMHREAQHVVLVSSYTSSLLSVDRQTLVLRHPRIALDIVYTTNNMHVMQP